MHDHDIYHYAGLTWWGPLSDDRMNAVLALIPLAAGARALDVGCGRGVLLRRLAAQTGAGGLGLDRSTAALALAERGRLEHAPEAAISWLQWDAAADPLPAGAFDLLSWLGGPFIGGDFPSTAAALAERVAPGGYLLIGHGFWRRPPPPPYLEATGLSADELGDVWQNAEIVQALGLRLLYSTISSRDEWDAFEERIRYNVEQRAIDRPDDPDPQGRLAQRRAWGEAQLRWGRGAMGFGLYLFRKPLG